MPPSSHMDRKMEQGSSITRQINAADEQAWLSLGSIAELMGDDEHAVISYERVLHHNPMNTIALNAMGCCYEKRENYTKGAECFERIVTIDQANGEAWTHLGYCSLMLNNLTSAYGAYQHALYHIPNPKDPNLWYGIGMLYDRYGSLEHAEEAFDAVLKMDAKFEMANEVRFRLGIISKQQGRYDEALDRLRRTLDDVQDREMAGDVWAQIGHTYELKNELHRAKHAYQQVVEHNPNNSKALQQLGWLCMKAQNESSMAIDYFKKAVAADSKDGQAWYLLGRCYMQVSNFEEAYHAYKQAINFDPSNPHVWISLGVLFSELKQLIDALEAYSRAISINSNICEVWYNVGCLYDSCNQRNDACDAYSKAVDLGADSQYIRERLGYLQAVENGQQSLTGIGSAPPTPQEPATTAPMSIGMHSKPGGQFQGGVPGPISAAPATSGGMSNPINNPMQLPSSSMTSAGMISGPSPSMAMNSGGPITPGSGPMGPGSIGGRSMMGPGPLMGSMMGGNVMPQSNLMSAIQAKEGMRYGHGEDSDKKLPPTRLAGLDPKSMGRRPGPPPPGISRDRLPMPMADAKSRR